MRASNKQITLVSEAELSALYDQPDLDSDQRLEYLNMTAEEQGLMRKRSSLGDGSKLETSNEVSVRFTALEEAITLQYTKNVLLLIM